jgi:ParB family chromosome partitioning protein
MGCPNVALAVAVHAMTSQVFYRRLRDDTALQITATAASLHRVEGSAASAAIEAAEEQWAERIPGNPADLFAWCLGQTQDALIDLLAFCAAQTVNAVRLKSDRDATARMRHAALLDDAVKLDMKAWFQPTAANYFAKVSKARIIDALREVKGAVAPAWNGMKKADLAVLAERAVAGTGWLPEPLSAPAPVSAPET